MTPTIDLTSFLMHGFSRVSLDTDILETVREPVRSEHWAVSTNDGTYEATWCTNNGVSVDGYAPDSYQPLVQHILDTTRNYFGQQVEIDSISLWKGAEELDWHNHIDDKEVEAIHWLVYLGDDEWHPDAGGLLLLKNQQLPDEVFTVPPTFGTAVLLNNTRHHFLHAVTKYTPLSNRIVLQIGMRVAH